MMVESIMVVTTKIKNMDLVFMYGEMVVHILEIGLRESKILKEYIYYQMVRFVKESGKQKSLVKSG